MRYNLITPSKSTQEICSYRDTISIDGSPDRSIISAFSTIAAGDRIAHNPRFIGLFIYPSKPGIYRVVAKFKASDGEISKFFRGVAISEQSEFFNLGVNIRILNDWHHKESLKRIRLLNFRNLQFQ